uniref:hypothetical protein n=1 Tax=Altererythrobacter segetis TaxID=1104773 RepID=UPI00140DCABB|nr:hypothetical protein [Altererythrobacter segetis]
MTVYKGGFRKAGPRLFWRPVCFTNEDKAAFWAVAMVGAAAEAALTGFVIGAVVGACYGFWLAWNAACPECGSCIEILGIQTLWPFSLFLPSVVPVVPIVARPSTADCPMIPPGCP